MNANFEKLRQYCDVKARLHTLQTEIVGDTAKDYSSGYPHSIRLNGIAQDDKTLSEIKLLHEKLNALDSLVDGIADVRAKNLVDLHYRKGMTWRQISCSTGRDSEAERQYLCRFLKKF